MCSFFNTPSTPVSTEQTSSYVRLADAVRHSGASSTNGGRRSHTAAAAVFGEPADEDTALAASVLQHFAGAGAGSANGAAAKVSLNGRFSVRQGQSHVDKS